MIYLQRLAVLGDVMPLHRVLRVTADRCNVEQSRADISSDVCTRPTRQLLNSTATSGNSLT